MMEQISDLESLALYTFILIGVTLIWNVAAAAWLHYKANGFLRATRCNPFIVRFKPWQLERILRQFNR